MRVRRDANDQLVLAHVYSRLSAMISHLTVQIFKDDWSRSSAYQIINNTSLPPMPPAVTPIKPPSHSGGYSGAATGLQGVDSSLLKGVGGVAPPWTSTPYGSPLPAGHSHKH